MADSRMHTSEHVTQVYEELAGCYDRRQQPRMRDIFLTLAADMAFRAGRAWEAEQVRQRLLWLNPHHLLKPYTSFAEALTSPDVEGYLTELRQRYPVEVAEQLLDSHWALQAAENGDAVNHAPDADVAATLPPMKRPRAVSAAASDIDCGRPGHEPPKEEKGPSVWPKEEAPEPPREDESEPLRLFRGNTDLGATLPPRKRQPRENGRPPRTELPRPEAERPLDETMPPRPAARGRTALPRPPAPPPLAPSAPPPRPAPPPPRAAAPPPSRYAVEEPADLPLPDDDEWFLGNGGWLATVLFVLVLAAAVGLAFVSLAP